MLELAAVALADCREATGRGGSIGPGRATGMNEPCFAADDAAFDAVRDDAATDAWWWNFLASLLTA